MTHSLHRRGSRSSLHDYFVILFRTDPAVPEQLEYKGTLAERAKIILKLLKGVPLEALEVETTGLRLRYMKGWEGITQSSGLHQASRVEDIFACSNLTWVRHVIIKGKINLVSLLQKVKEQDLGISMVISGVFDEIEEACSTAELTPHSVNMSLGIWGNTALLPDEDILQFCTMCGHSIIAPNLVKKLVNDVKEKRCCSIEAAVEIGKQCTCNIFNIERAVRLMAE